jgi:hypothetical protein
MKAPDSKFRQQLKRLAVRAETNADKYHAIGDIPTVDRLMLVAHLAHALSSAIMMTFDEDIP